MITLTTPRPLQIILGGNTSVNYNKLVVGPFTENAITQTVDATLVLTATASAQASPINGRLSINIPGGNKLTLEITQLDISTTVTLTSPQATAIINAIEAAQAALENGLITLGVVAGTRTAGV